MEVKESDDFPQGDKSLRREDHQAFVREFIFDIKDNKHRLLATVPKEKNDRPARTASSRSDRWRLQPGGNPGRKRPGRRRPPSCAPRS